MIVNAAMKLGIRSPAILALCKTETLDENLIQAAMTRLNVGREQAKAWVESEVCKRTGETCRALHLDKKGITV